VVRGCDAGFELGCALVGGGGGVLLPPPPEVGGRDVGGVEVGGDEVGGVDVPWSEPICRIPPTFRESGTLSDSAPSCRLMPGFDAGVAAAGVDAADRDGRTVAATAGMTITDSAAPTMATDRRIVRTSGFLTCRMTPLRSNCSAGSCTPRWRPRLASCEF
jgi:hypothetical protein